MKTIIFVEKLDKNNVIFLDSIVNHYTSYGHDEFYFLCGENFDVIEKWLNTKPVSINGNIIYTGKSTPSAKRLLEVEEYIDGESFLLIYSSRFMKVDINEAIRHHKREGKVATLTSFMTGKDNSAILEYTEGGIEKGKNTVINAGFMVLEPEVLEYITDDTPSFEKDVIISLAQNDEVSVCKYYAFDTVKQKL